jgi:hypothetical protein
MIWGVLLGDCSPDRLAEFCNKIVILPHVEDGVDEAIDEVFDI